MYFDAEKADRVCNFFECILKHTKGEYGGKPFKPLPWQEEGLSHVFGTVDDDGYRIVRTWYDEVPKKAGNQSRRPA